jgi:hypothetical protein
MNNRRRVASCDATVDGLTQIHRYFTSRKQTYLASISLPLSNTTLATHAAHLVNAATFHIPIEPRRRPGGF